MYKKNRKFSCELFKIHGNSLDGLIEKISKSRKYKRIKNKLGMICINIECILNDIVFLYDIIDTINHISVLKYKKIISSIATSRDLYISSNLDEIYCETICADLSDEYSFSPAIFDYGLLYGNYRMYNKDEEVAIKNLHRSYGNNVDFKIDEVLTPANSIINERSISYGVFCMYGGTVYDDGKPVKYLYEADLPIPVSLFKPLNEEGYYNGQKEQ